MTFVSHGLEATSTLIVSSAPLHWPNIAVERHLVTVSDQLQDKNRFSSHRVLLIEEGAAGTGELDRSPFHLDRLAKSLIVAPMGVPLELSPLAPLRIIRLFLDPAFIDAVARSLLGEISVRLMPFSGRADGEFIGIVSLLVDAATGHQPLDDQMLAVLMREIAVRVVHGHSDQRFDRPDLVGKLPVASTARVLRLIGTQLGEPISVEQMAKEAGFSRSHFSRAFSKTIGRSPHAYLQSRRIARAAYLLRNTAQTLDKIAADCGFHDQAHFNRSFKAKHGITPRRFRTLESNHN